jgi:TraX protein
MDAQNAPSDSFGVLTLPRLSGGAQDALKLIALGAMLLDHTNKIVLNESAPALSWIGRLAFPLFAFLIAYNLEKRSVDPRRYALPLLISGLISQPFFAAAFHVPRVNIFFTLLLGIALWHLHRILEKRDYGWSIWLVGLVFVGLNWWTDYPILGCVIIPVWAAILRNPTGLNWLIWGFVTLCLNFFLPESYVALLTVPLILLLAQVLKDHLRLLTRERFLAYGFYPIHLLLLIAIRTIQK